MTGTELVVVGRQEMVTLEIRNGELYEVRRMSDATRSLISRQAEARKAAVHRRLDGDVLPPCHAGNHVTDVNVNRWGDEVTYCLKCGERLSYRPGEEPTFLYDDIFWLKSFDRTRLKVLRRVPEEVRVTPR